VGPKSRQQKGAAVSRRRVEQQRRTAVRGVVFDVDGTLVSLRGGLGELYAEALNDLGVSVEASRLSAAIAAEWPLFEPQYLASAEGHRTSVPREVTVWVEFVRRVLARIDARLAGERELLGGVYAFFSEGRSRRAVPGALAACERLHERGLMAIAATNNDIRTARVLKELGFSPFLCSVVTAGEVGWKKPAPQFFCGVAQAAGAALGELLHVGNNSALDVEAAERAGMRAVLFDPAGAAKSGIARISSLSELEQLVW